MLILISLTFVSRVIIWEVVDSAFWLEVGRSCTRIPSESFGPPFLLSPDRLLPGAGSAMGPVGRLGPHSQLSSTSRICPWGCCSNCLTNTTGAAVPGPVNIGIITSAALLDLQGIISYHHQHHLHLFSSSDDLVCITGRWNPNSPVILTYDLVCLIGRWNPLAYLLSICCLVYSFIHIYRSF